MRLQTGAQNQTRAGGRVIVKPDTVIRWHRKGFHLDWRAISKRGSGRAPVSQEVQGLIRRLAGENGGRARTIPAELEKLGFTVSLASVSRYRPKREPDDGPRKILHFNLTANPTAQWVIQPLRDAFPGESAPGSLIYDNDSIVSAEVTEAIEPFQGRPKRTAYRSPWQNGTAERWVGSARRERLDPGIVWNERHLRRWLRDSLAYDNADRVHTRLGDAPLGRPTENRPSPDAQVVGLPRVGGLQHRYVWREAA